MVTDMHITSTGNELLRNVNVNDIEPPKHGVLVIFCNFRQQYAFQE